MSPLLSMTRQILLSIIRLSGEARMLSLALPGYASKVLGRLSDSRSHIPLFDAAWYRAQYLGAEDGEALQHYVDDGAGRGYDPHPLFSTPWYLSQCPDAEAAARNPLEHFLTRGAAEGRNPCPLLDPVWYAAQYPEARAYPHPLLHFAERGRSAGNNPQPLFWHDWYLRRSQDVVAAGVDPLRHFWEHGAAEGRSPCPLFDPVWYLNQYPEARDRMPLLHYVETGAARGYDPHPLFVTSFYLSRNPGVATSGANPLQHFWEHGARERRTPCPFFDPDWYAARYPEAAANPLLHYLEEGWAKACHPHPLFDTAWFLQQNPDIASSHEDPLRHFVEFPRECRNPCPLFDPAWYIARHPEAAATGRAALLHYLEDGAARGYDPHPLFDTRFYLAQNPDGLTEGVTPVEHFLAQSGHLSTTPCRFFDPEWYVARYPEAAAENPLRHYLVVGAAKNYDPHPLFDAGWFLEQNPDIAASGENVLRHFVEFPGECRNPCPLFDPDWYVAAHPEVASDLAGRPPLLHYLEEGAARGYDPHPLFQSRFYLEQNPDVAATGVNPLLHYLRVGGDEGRNPNPFFDTRWYRQQPPEIPSQANPLVHYLLCGAREGRDPSPRFSTTWYLNAYADVAEHGVNPLAHYLDRGKREYRWLPGLDPIELEAGRYSEPGPHFEELDSSIAAATPAQAKVIAFYLPQFHPIPENDEWWGEGFTEWRNVTRGRPRFQGHHQPRLPRNLGFYDLRDPAVLATQARLARESGVFGFSFYFYWFNRHRLLERPLELLLEHREIDLPFCLTWANENWTRRWDGFDDDVLIRQDYRVEDEPALLAELARHFKDARYIRVEGRPVFVIYRPGLIPDAKRVFDRWRVAFEKDHDERPLLFMVQGFGDSDPREIGLDAAVEFPPHKVAQGLPPINHALSIIDPAFQGRALSYAAMMAASLAVKPPRFPLLRGVTPSWDNEARRPGKGVTYVGSTPALYEGWLRAMVGYARTHPVHGEALVFVNAWNEWAEGAYLEPDLHNGGAYLNATARATRALPRRVRPAIRGEKRRILLVGHDAALHGAQLNLLSIARTLQGFGVEVSVILLAGGPLVERYESVVPTTVLDGDRDAFEPLARQLREEGYSWAICNTVVSGGIADVLHRLEFQVTALVHELGTFIEERHLVHEAIAAGAHATHVVFASSFVRDSFENLAGPLGEHAVILPQGVYQSLDPIPGARERVRRELGLPEDALVVLNAGFGDLRKGFDLFLQLTRLLAARDPRFYCVWVGDISSDLEVWLRRDREEGALKRHFRQVPFTDEVARYYHSADVFALTSREDPFPSVVMESLATGTPVVAFEGGGGYVDIVADSRYGRLVPFGDIVEMADAVCGLVQVEAEGGGRLREERRQRSIEQFDFRRFAFELLRLFEPELRRVSVVVPNYNYAHYLEERLATIFDQTHPIYEVLVLDDCSTDDSLGVLERVQAVGRALRILPNTENAGAVARQWLKGVGTASGDLVWIAEADDQSDPRFLDELATAFADREVVLAFTDSVQLDENGQRIGDSYQPYYQTIQDLDWKNGFVVSGREFLCHGLSVKNTILNLSAVLFRKEPLLAGLRGIQDELASYRVAADWRLYIELLSGSGRMAFAAKSLNRHRRHPAGITLSLEADRHLGEIKRVHDHLETIGAGSDVSRARYIDEVIEYFGSRSS